MLRGAPRGHLEGLLVARTISPDSDKQRRVRQELTDLIRVTPGDLG